MSSRGTPPFAPLRAGSASGCLAPRAVGMTVKEALAAVCGISDGRCLGRSGSVGEDVPLGFPVASDEEVQDLVLEREEVFEEALQLVGAAAAGLAEVLELVLEDLLARVAVENHEHDVEQEPGLLDVDLPVIGPAVDRGDVFLGLVAGAIFDAELQAPRNDDLRAGLGAESAPELGRAPELGQVLGRQLPLGRDRDDLELRLLLDLLLQKALELR